jgi:hypothetical protein
MPIAVGRQFGDHRLHLCEKLVVRQWRPTDPLLGTLLQALRQVRTRHPNHSSNGLHRESSFGGNFDSRSRFFEPMVFESLLENLGFRGFLAE